MLLKSVNTVLKLEPLMGGARPVCISTAVLSFIFHPNTHENDPRLIQILSQTSPIHTFTTENDKKLNK